VCEKRRRQARLCRRGVTRDGEKGHAYSVPEDEADTRGFLARGRDDRHQFPLAPEDAAECEIVSKKVDSTYRSDRCPVWIKVRNPPASLCSGRG
jgi:hypothetical protein